MQKQKAAAVGARIRYSEKEPERYRVKIKSEWKEGWGC